MSNNAYELMAALCKIIKDNDGSIPQHERPRVKEIVERLNNDDACILDKLSFADRYEYPALRGHNGGSEHPASHWGQRPANNADKYLPKPTDRQLLEEIAEGLRRRNG